MFSVAAQPVLDGRQYVYRVQAPDDAPAADPLYRAAFHCHDYGPHPRASDRFGLAAIRRNSRANGAGRPSVLKVEAVAVTFRAP